MATEPETGSNIDASIGNIDLLGDEMLIEDGKATELDDADDVYRVTQDAGISDGPTPEWQDSLSEIMAGTGGDNVGRKLRLIISTKYDTMQ